jgi:hypothetical protein
VQVGGPVAGYAEQLSRRAQRHHQVDRLIQVVAHHDRQVAAAETHVHEPSVQEDVAGGVGVGHRERPGTAGGLVVLLGTGDHRLHDLLGAVDPLVVDSLPPHDHDQLPAGHQRLADVAQRRHRVGEEHRPEARERHVEAVVERRRLHVGDQEARVGHAGLGGLGARGLDEPLRGIHAHGLALGPHQPGDPLGRVAEPAPDVQHPLAGQRREELQRLLAVGAQPRGHDLPEPHEALVQRPVPGRDRLGVGPRTPARLGRAHLS